MEVKGKTRAEPWVGRDQDRKRKELRLEQTVEGKVGEVEGLAERGRACREGWR